MAVMHGCLSYDALPPFICINDTCAFSTYAVVGTVCSTTKLSARLIWPMTYYRFDEDIASETFRNILKDSDSFVDHSFDYIV